MGPLLRTGFWWTELARGSQDTGFCHPSISSSHISALEVPATPSAHTCDSGFLSIGCQPITLAGERHAGPLRCHPSSPAGSQWSWGAGPEQSFSQGPQTNRALGQVGSGACTLTTNPGRGKQGLPASCTTRPTPQTSPSSRAQQGTMFVEPKEMLQSWGGVQCE